MPSTGSFFRQKSGREGCISTSKGFRRGKYGEEEDADYSGGGGGSWDQLEGPNSSSSGGATMRKKKNKRVMVVVDQTSYSEHAMKWALTHLANEGDFFTLLHIIPVSTSINDSVKASSSSSLANSLGSFCKASKPEVEVEAVVIQGPKLDTVLSQVKKLDVSVLVLGQNKHCKLFGCIWGCSSSGSRGDEFVEECINMAECWTIGVRRQSNGIGGYLINTRWHKNFWLLA